MFHVVRGIKGFPVVDLCEFALGFGERVVGSHVESVMVEREVEFQTFGVALSLNLAITQGRVFGLNVRGEVFHVTHILVKNTRIKR